MLEKKTGKIINERHLGKGRSRRASATLKFDTWMKDVAKRGQGKGHEVKRILRMNNLEELIVIVKKWLFIRFEKD